MTTNPLRSTDQIDISKFRPHGRVDYKLLGRLLETTALGPFNEELVAALQELVTFIFPQMAAQGAWAQYVIFQESALMSNEVLASLTKLLTNLTKSGIAPVATAFVLSPEVEGESFMAPLYANCYREAGRRFAAFARVEEAVAWVNACLDENCSE